MSEDKARKNTVEPLGPSADAEQSSKCETQSAVKKPALKKGKKAVIRRRISISYGSETYNDEIPDPDSDSLPE